MNADILSWLKYEDMRYFIRSVKYFLYFTVLFVIIMALLIFAGATEGGDINTMFRGGYKALWQIALLFAVIAAVYPSVGFIRKDAIIKGSWEETKDEVTALMEQRGYIKAAEDTGTMTFRKTGVSRFTRMYEDSITLTAKIGGVEVEGLRKDVVRIVSALEYRFRNMDED